MKRQQNSTNFRTVLSRRLSISTCPNTECRYIHLQWNLDNPTRFRKHITFQIEQVNKFLDVSSVVYNNGYVYFRMQSDSKGCWIMEFPLNSLDSGNVRI